MENPPVYVFQSVEGLLKEKINRLAEDFEKRYEAKPQFVARVPGR